MEKTLQQYNRELDICRDLFYKKTKDYGTAWRVLRPASLTDQIFIKAQRIRTLQEKGISKVGEGIHEEFVGIVNYAVMALIQCQLGVEGNMELPADEALNLYNQHAFATRDLMMKKNHDYGEAWRNMRVSSLTDLILMKILRIKQIEDNQGKTMVSEGVEAGYADMMNYAIFALILLHEQG
ncbi:MAG TPA: DUF1599 domain-containing protein [Flavobacteriales bacterium]|nr:DUF1599 domain-containing protein [Flavobacteriales bacterium]